MSKQSSRRTDDPKYRSQATRASLNVGFVLAAFYISTWGYTGELAAAFGVLLVRYGLIPFFMAALLWIWKEHWPEARGALMAWHCTSIVVASVHLGALHAELRLLALVPCCSAIEAMVYQHGERAPLGQKLWPAVRWVGISVLLHLAAYCAMRYLSS